MGVMSPDEAGGPGGFPRESRPGRPSAETSPASAAWTAASAAEDFDTFAVAVTPRLVRLAQSMGAGRPDAEDAAAEALARAYASWSRVKAMANPEGWAMRVAANLACDRARRTRRESSSGLPRDPASVIGFEDLVATRAELLAALRRLPRRQREAVALRHLGGLSLKDVATVQGVSPGAAGKRVERALSALRELLPGHDSEHHRAQREE